MKRIALVAIVLLIPQVGYSMEWPTRKTDHDFKCVVGEWNGRRVIAGSEVWTSNHQRYDTALRECVRQVRNHPGMGYELVGGVYSALPAGPEPDPQPEPDPDPEPTDLLDEVTMSSYSSGVQWAWTAGFDQTDADGRLEIDFIAPEIISQSMALIAGDSFAVWLWKGEVHFEVGPRDPRSILRPASQQFQPNTKHTVTLSWSDGQVALALNGEWFINYPQWPHTIFETGSVTLAANPYGDNPGDWVGESAYRVYDQPADMPSECEPLGTVNIEPIPAASTCVGSAALRWAAPTESRDEICGVAEGDLPTDTRGLAMYRVYYGDSSEDYNHTVDIPANRRSAVIEDLSFGSWFFAMTSIDLAGRESIFSNEVVKQVPGDE